MVEVCLVWCFVFSALAVILMGYAKMDGMQNLYVGAS